MRLIVFRQFQSGLKKGQWKSEWLPGSTEKEDVPSEAWALIQDKRDSILSVKAWDERLQQFAPFTFERGWSYDGTHKLADGEIDVVTGS